MGRRVLKSARNHQLIGLLVMLLGPLSTLCKSILDWVESWRLKTLPTPGEVGV
jgi:hypothetical protein